MDQVNCRAQCSSISLGIADPDGSLNRNKLRLALEHTHTRTRAHAPPSAQTHTQTSWTDRLPRTRRRATGVHLRAYRPTQTPLHVFRGATTTAESSKGVKWSDSSGRRWRWRVAAVIGKTLAQAPAVAPRVISAEGCLPVFVAAAEGFGFLGWRFLYRFLRVSLFFVSVALLLAIPLLFCSLLSQFLFYFFLCTSTLSLRESLAARLVDISSKFSLGVLLQIVFLGAIWPRGYFKFSFKACLGFPLQVFVSCSGFESSFCYFLKMLKPFAVAFCRFLMCQI